MGEEDQRDSQVFWQLERQPVASTDDYDIYTIRRHLPDSGRGLGTAILGVYTLGASEVIALPIAVTRWTVQSTMQRYVLFKFDAEGHITNHQGWSPQPTSRKLARLIQEAELPPPIYSLPDAGAEVTQ